MPKKAFDLMPPYPQPSKYHHHMSKSKREKVKARKTFFFFFFGLFFIGVFFILMKLGNTPGASQKQSSLSSSSTSINSKFELFNNQGDSNLGGTQNIITVRLSNGAGQTNNVGVAQDLLLTKGFEIEKTVSANSDSNQTIIYYKNNHLDQAQKAADALKPSFAAEVQPSSTLEKNYDILIMVGVK